MNNERTVYGMDMERQPAGETSAGRGGGGEMECAARGGANQRIEQNNEIESLVVAAHTFHAWIFRLPRHVRAAAESPVIALVKSRVMPESVYNTHRFLQIKTWGTRATAWSLADDVRRNGSKSNYNPSWHTTFSIPYRRRDIREEL